MSTFLCKNGVRKEYFLTPTFIIEPYFLIIIKNVFLLKKVPCFLKESKGQDKLIRHRQNPRGYPDGRSFQ